MAPKSKKEAFEEALNKFSFDDARERCRENYLDAKTLKTYEPGIQKYINFCSHNGLTPFPATIPQLEGFAGVMIETGYNSSTYLSGVK